jgi:hypothetical protein
VSGKDSAGVLLFRNRAPAPLIARLPEAVEAR